MYTKKDNTKTAATVARVYKSTVLSVLASLNGNAHESCVNALFMQICIRTRIDPRVKASLKKSSDMNHNHDGRTQNDWRQEVLHKNNPRHSLLCVGFSQFQHEQDIVGCRRYCHHHENQIERAINSCRAEKQQKSETPNERGKRPPKRVRNLPSGTSQI